MCIYLINSLKKILAVCNLKTLFLVLKIIFKSDIMSLNANMYSKALS